MGRGKNWTAADENTLEEMWGNKSIQAISRRLGRSESAVKIRAGRMGLGPWLTAGERITMNQLSLAIRGIPMDQHFQRKMTGLGMPVHRKRREKRSYCMVDIDEFWTWAEAHRSKIDFSRMEPLALGWEPDWLSAQRRTDYEAARHLRKSRWTAEEDDRLKHLVADGRYSYREIARKLSRGEGAVSRRCYVIGLEERPKRAPCGGPEASWSREQLETLADGIRSGAGYGVIAERIGKSERAVRGKVFRIYLTERLDEARKMIGDGP